MDITFLTVPDVLRLHEDQVTRYGGEASIRDHGLLHSAVAMPQTSFGGDHLHEFPHEMAAAYLFHLVQNHPFVDGNKRTGLAAALMFLTLNGYDLQAERKLVEDLVLAVSQGQLGKSSIAEFFKDHVVAESD